MLDQVTAGLLKEAVLREGFALEWRVSRVLNELKFNVEMNFTHNEQQNDGSVLTSEIDVVGRVSGLDVGQLLICECKGGASDDVLMLTEYSKEVSLPSIQITSNTVTINRAENILVDKSRGPFLCHTGDFLSKGQGANNTGYKKSSKQDDRSNFFKGAQQVINGVSVYLSELRSSRRSTETSYFCLPILVTNTNIVVARFPDTGDGMSSQPPALLEVPWAACRNDRAYGATSVIYSSSWYEVNPGDKRTSIDGHRKHLEYFWVVNVLALKSFLESRLKTYNPTPVQV